MKKWIILLLTLVYSTVSAEEQISESASRIETLIRSMADSGGEFISDYEGQPTRKAKEILDDPQNLEQELGRLIDISFPADVRAAALSAMTLRKEYSSSSLEVAMAGWLDKYKELELDSSTELRFERNYYVLLLEAVASKCNSSVVDLALKRFPIRDGEVASKTVKMIGLLGNQKQLEELQYLTERTDGKLKEEMAKAVALIGSRKAPTTERTTEPPIEIGGAKHPGNGIGRTGIIVSGVVLLGILLGYAFRIRKKRGWNR